MSLVFNDTSTFRGLVQIYEREIGANQGDISGDTTKLKQFTADCNLALDDFVVLALKSSGRWQFDDSNQTDYPIISTNLISGQRDYSFTTDGSGNLILDIYKVFVANASGLFTEITPVDVQSATNLGSFGNTSGRVWNNSDDLSSFTNGQNASGVPFRYDKTANSIFLDPIPNYNYTNGLKVYINREATYFSYDDTTKSAGIPGTFHKYLALKPALDYARRNSLANLPRLEAEVVKLEGLPGQPGLIAEYFGRRARDERWRLTIKNDSCK